VRTALRMALGSSQNDGAHDRPWCAIVRPIFHSALVRISFTKMRVSSLTINAGQYNCIGQQLAWRIMRYTIARVVCRFTFCLAPGYDGQSMERDKVDRFTAFPGAVPLCFKLRST